METIPQPYFLPYRQHGEPEHRAGFAAVDFPWQELSSSEAELLHYLCLAAEEMNEVFCWQFCPDTSIILHFLDTITPYANEHEGESLSAYRHLLLLQNAPWSLQPRKNHLLEIEEERVKALAELAGSLEAFLHIRRYLFDLVPVPGRCSFYPPDLTDEELESLGSPAGEVNRVLFRGNDGGVDTIRNEQLFPEACGRAADYLRKAWELSDNISFKLYLDAKITELETGSLEARRVADYLWIRHDSPIDIVISTALEVYLDAWKNNKGAACAAVTRIDTKSDRLIKDLLGLVPELEATAPWKWKRSEIDVHCLPRLKFVDVLLWSGDYVTGPMTVGAQSLPNDEWIGKNIGTVNMVYQNTGRAVHSLSGSILADQFLPREILDIVGKSLFEGGQLHSALHEIGHTTGLQDPDHQGEASVWLGGEYSTFEELRAELFGMWACEKAVAASVIDRPLADAAHYAMLLTMLRSLAFVPDQAHTNARNIMFHYFEEKRAIVSTTEGRFRYDFALLHPAVERLLAEVADIKASGNLSAAKGLKERFCYDHPDRKLFEEKTKALPLGRGLIFPIVEVHDGKVSCHYDDFLHRQGEK
ncbi:hypothetical protein [Sediminispirochaeta smaragdinae]|uniref:Peptidase M49 n=1 Tax=Sediminispirochaeta smaragdinae (strain DSM 11293 / JCM 15392 / SEBR 4228) TaxID=573413 RepID=E1R4V9_SEDSS|nr:hypothetical protein [Sediminispirochaeta smaragdinae]ADK82197.1 hypothetical protein Spirs_3097 [Sediminispirochaeta smaragdinae DSM 11293]